MDANLGPGWSKGVGSSERLALTISDTHDMLISSFGSGERYGAGDVLEYSCVGYVLEVDTLGMR